MNVNNKMITIAREVRGMTQMQLSASIPKLSQGNLSKMEKGIIGVTEEVIEKIASALNFPVSFFYEEYTFPPFSNVYYRKLITASVKKMSQLEAIFKTTMFVVDNMLESIEIPEYSIPELDVEDEFAKTNTNKIIQRVQDIARRVRFALGIPDGPITDIADILEKNGIIIIEINTDMEKFSGMSAQTQNGVKIIFLNGNMSNDRKRFTIAHELGHIVMHIPFIAISEDRDLENEANVFAGEFLMPYKDFRKDVSQYLSYNDLDMLKVYWRASKQAIIRKAYQNQIISPQRYQSLMVQMSMNGERKCERIIVDFPDPKLLKKIIDVFYDDLGYTQDDLTQAISVNLHSLPLMINKRPNMILLRSKTRIQL